MTLIEVLAKPDAEKAPAARPALSVLVPVYDEEDSVAPLWERLRETLGALGRPYEVIFVNDGSTDGSAAALNALAEQSRRVKVIHLRRNCGQTGALMAGIDHARGDVLVPIDADLQNDPADIPRLLEKLEEGYDVVSGWRKHRRDAALRRNLPSRVANRFISWVFGVKLHDYGCTLKAYRRDVIKDVRLYGEMHRFIPVYASWQGARVTEITVQHHPRRHGRSKYGLSRLVKVLLDVMVVRFLDKYLTKPIYVFGAFAILSFAISFLAGVYALYLKFVEGTSFIQTPMPLLTVMTFVTGMMSLLMGLLAELLVRTYFESQRRGIYMVRERINFDGD
jgi:dolichol-phosphate mannosyltransferase